MNHTKGQWNFYDFDDEPRGFTIVADQEDGSKIPIGIVFSQNGQGLRNAHLITYLVNIFQKTNPDNPISAG